MRLGYNYGIKHSSPEEWGEKLKKKGCRASCFPVDYKAPVSLIDRYVKAAEDNDILIAETGVWRSPWNTNPEEAKTAKERCLEQLRLAEYVHARCCVNVSGAAGPWWPYCYPENFTEELYDKNIRFIQYLLDTVKPKHTSYCLETMQWMVPWSSKQYLQMIKDIDRPGFKVHLDPFNLINDPYTYTHQKELIDEAFLLLHDYMVGFHVKDVILDPVITVMIHETQIGEGSFDHAYYLKKISELNDPDVPVLIEHREKESDYDEALKYLSALLEK